MKRAWLTYVLPLLATLFWAVGNAHAETNFTRDIRPILSDKCFQCHGPDAAARKADLALHLEAPAHASGVIVAGDAASSPLVARIHDADPNKMMPPPESNLSLSDEEKRLLTQWINEGAKYEKHWAFSQVEVAAPPQVEDGRVHNPIDAFVLSRLQREGVEPSPEARRETLIRRLSFDLTGLPPTPEEVQRFLDNHAPDAYETLLEELLARPGYGERMANDWLDAARFGDTYGYQNDREMRTWPWRDWLIKAFNDNLPYDDFIRWQIAGDLLPEATQEQRLATMFNRLHRQTNEGGSVPEEFRIEYVADRTQTVGTAFLGLTLECARCHDHKYDPISQQNYYEMTAFFDNIDESGMYSHFTDATPTPSMLLYTDAQRGKHGALKDLIADQVNDLPVAEKFAAVRFSQWLTDAERATPEPQPLLHFAFEALEGDATPNTANPDAMGKTALNPALVPGKIGQAVLFDGENSVTQKDAGNFERIDPFSVSLWIKPPPHEPHMVVAHKSMAELDAASRGWELLLQDGRPVFSLVHFWPGNAVRVQCRDALPVDEWAHVAVTYDGSSRAEGVRLFINGKPALHDVVRNRLVKSIRYPAPPPLTLGARFRDVGFKGGAVDEFMLFDRRLSALEVQGIAHGRSMAEMVAGHLGVANEDLLFEYYLLTQDAPYAVVLDRVYRARREEFELVESVPDVMVMSEMPEPRQTYFLERGEYHAKTHPVYPATPEEIFPFPEHLPRNRLGFAEWMLDRDNPLTARVAVNRYWQLFFGRGLVDTQEDFGSQGSLPSHPELLDYLAHWFMENNWDVKALCRLIATSATYRQDSAPRPDLHEKDPHNVLLARGPRHRLSAEQLRDNALATSGLLVDTIGGPSVKPYQPEDIWEDSSSTKYVQDKGDALYRRSMYTYWKRTVPHPAMMTFDAPNREVCTARRETTQTPLQALVLLNDPQFVEAARVMAENVVSGRRPFRENLQAVFLRLLSRAPDATEFAILETAYLEQREHFLQHRGAAEAYATIGEKTPLENVRPVDVAALASVIQLLMNHEEFQVKP